jgi:adenylate cyclase
MRMNTPVNVAAEYEGKTYLGVVQVFRVTGGPDWALVSIVPEARFLAASIANTKIAAAVGLLIVVVAISLGWVVSDRVSRPLLKMTNVLERIGRFELSGKATSSSFITEIAVVGDSVDRMQASLRSFSHYVPIDLVREVIASGKEAQLGGANRDLTLLISDIAGFTAISEQLTPNTLVAQLAQYLDAMTDAITAEGGTIDKYVGDGIVAFFNAPTLLPEHAIAACRAALAAQKALHSLQEEWAARGMPAFVTRIGINRGEVVVGNIGTHERFAYTAMGDAMNLASRLEGLNKIYGTRLLASEAVWEEAKSQFEWRRLDRVAVVGRSQSTLVFELLGEVGRLPQAALDARDQYETALDAYFSGHFSKAAAGFGLAGRMRPDDQAAEVMLQRILDLARNPPGPQWNGVFASREK